jgi:hypothetical protein
LLPSFHLQHHLPRLPKGVPVGIIKYDSKQDPRQWIRCYSTTIEVSGSSNTTKVIYFSMALESALLTWLKSLKPDSIDSWEDLKKTFVDNFQGSMLRVGTCHDLSQVKQEENETLRSYIRRFFEMHATIANITDEDVIHYFQNGLGSKNIYRNFGRSRPKTVVELHNMMQQWADQEDEENKRFPKRNNDKHNNGNRSDKSQWNYSEPSLKRKPDHEVMAVECNSRGKKLGNQQDQFEKILHKQCPMHPKSKHTLF